MVKDKLILNIKKLQNLKFEIYSRSSDLDFHDFDLYTLKVKDEEIDLIEWISYYQNTYMLSEIAEMIIQKYQL